MKIEAKFTYDKVNHAEENEVHAVVSLIAPKIDWEKNRAPICIIPVIDCSTSMGDQGKIEFAKQSVMRLIENLQPGDYCGLVAFDSGVKAISPPREMTSAGKDKLKAAVGQLYSSGMTNFSGGMRQALEWINEAQASGWDVLVDCAAFVPTNRLDLSRWHPDFVPLSFYKIFGYPTGVGCLLARRDALARLSRPWFAGGTIAIASVQAGDYSS